MNIAKIEAFQIYDSRGNPTVEVELTLANGDTGHGLVPSGASTGQFEALELRDNDISLFRGKSVFSAIKNINEIIAPAIQGRDVCDQKSIDDVLIDIDGSPDKSRLGANAVLGVSMAVAQAAAVSRNVPLYHSLSDGKGRLLPLPEIQIIGGGAHADWRTDIQDCLVIATGAESYEHTLEITFNIYHAAAELLKKRGKYCGLADEGGFWPDVSTNEEALATLNEAISCAGYTPGKEAAISLDIAASDLYDPKTGKYAFELENRSFTSEEFVELMLEWCNRYPVVSIEDPLADTDLPGWRRFYAAQGGRLQIVGDDLFTTNPARIRQGVVSGDMANAVLIKLNQIGTVTEAMTAVRITQEAGWSPIVSARSGETEDAFISHLAVATNAGQLKVGAFARSERMVKWNECLRINRHLGRRAQFIGSAALYPFRSS